MTRWWLPLIALGWAGVASAQAPPPPGPAPVAPFNAFVDQGSPDEASGNPAFGFEGGPAVGYPPPPAMGGMPMMPGIEPAGDGDTNPNAFGNSEPPPPAQGLWYAGVGFQGLMRQRLGHGVLAILDPGNNIPGFPFNADTGIPPPNAAPTLLNFADVAPLFNWGTKATLGYRAGDHAIEVTGYYLGLNTAAKAVSLPGQVDLPFSAFDPPLGFTGNNFLWLQADFAEAILQTRIANAEVNYRFNASANVELIAGLRYMDVQERFSILTDDDGIILQSLDPFGQAIYSINTHNRIVAPQLGLALEAPLAQWLAFSFESKGAWGANFFSQDHLLLRGDGFVGPSSHVNRTIISQVYDLSVYANIGMGERARVRVGYTALWVADIPVASQQVDFNPNNPLGRRDDHGSIFFHGPSVEIQFAW